MGTPILFHGPLARGEAVAHAAQLGRLVSEPIGDDGLKVADSRLIVILSEDAGVGDKLPVVIVGPLDRATPEAGDALLKTLEDLTDAPLQIVLWADYLGGVIGTIRSRSLDRWCPPDERWVSPFVDQYAEALFSAWEKQDTAACLSVLYERKKDWQALMQGFCEVMAERAPEKPQTARVWPLLRPLLDGKGSHLNAATALLEALEGEA